MNKIDFDRKILPVKSDIIFKIFFADERNIEFLTDFLKSALQIPPQEYQELTIAEGETELDTIAAKNPVISKAVSRLKELSADEQVRDAYFERELARMDSEVREDAAHSRGLAKGHIEIQKQVIQNALKMNMSIEDISNLTGLTSEEIDEMGGA
ncbi:MAG: hypothetical protein FWB75_04900 [Oscillospiraceae bacterium]|nr:hypothetical protein [Oscillospiraceae bacterium]